MMPTPLPLTKLSPPRITATMGMGTQEEEVIILAEEVVVEGTTGIMTVWITDRVLLLVVIMMVAVVKAGVIVVAAAEMEALVPVVADLVIDSHSKSFIALLFVSLCFLYFF